MIQFDEHIFQMGWNHQLEFGLGRKLQCSEEVQFLGVLFGVSSELQDV